jgi:glycosyltransferase involved in cell wall biosynthesis
MKVVFVHPSYPNQFTRVAHTLSQRAGWDCACLVDERFADAVRRDDPPIAYYGFREEPAPASGNYYTQCVEDGIRCGKAVVEALSHLHAAGEVDVVVGHASFGTTFFVRRLLRIPVLAYVELPGYLPVYCRDEFPAQFPQDLMDVSLRALIHASVLQSDLCLVPSQHAKDLFPTELRHKIRVQPEGFDLPTLVRDTAALRRDLGLSGSGPVVGFAGRTLEAVRGFDVFVRMAKAIRLARPDVQFLALGDEATLYGNETAYLGGKSFKQHVLETERVDERAITFKPFAPHGEFTRYLQAMDLIVFPIFEGAGNWAVFDAMAAAVPVLASNRCFIPEVITHGHDGLLFDPDDVDGLVHAALTALGNPGRLRALGRQARRTIAERFSLRRAADGYAALIQEAVRAGFDPRSRVRIEPEAGARTLGSPFTRSRHRRSRPGGAAKPANRDHRSGGWRRS